MRQTFKELIVKTRGRGFYEITSDVSNLIDVQVGVVTLHVQHTSASLVIQENADPEVQRDFERFFTRLVPDGDPLFQHTCEGDDDMPAHIRSALTAVNLSIPISGRRMTLGTWQGIYLWEHRAIAHTRRIAVHVIGE